MTTLESPTPPLALRFQVAQSSDEPEIMAFFKECLAEFGLPYLPGISDQDITDIDQTYAVRGLFMTVRFQGKIVGMAGLRQSADPEAAELTKLYLDPAFRNDGLGTLMLDLLVAQAKEYRYQRITLLTNTKLQAAVHLFKKRGFIPDLDQADMPDSCDLRLTLDPVFIREEC